MSEIRKDLVSGRWVIVGNNGISLPESRQADEDDSPDYDPKCPYCGGNEHMTQPEVSLVKAQDDPDSDEWIVRVVPNYQPILKPVGEPVVRRHHIHQFISGVGSHEIIAESPVHSAEPYDQPLDKFAAVIATYRDRMLAVGSDRRFEYVSASRNHGRLAGSVSTHPCSEIIAMPLVPMAVQEELKQSADYYDFASSCVVCDLIRDELSAKLRIAMENDAFIAITPYAARVPFETWIVPRRHSASFTDITDAETKELALCLARVLLVFAEDLGDPPYSYYIHTSPARVYDLEYYHWHLELVPRLTEAIGVDYGTGIPVNLMSPEKCATFLNRRLTVI